MRALIVYESVYGNTRAIAEAIADGIGAGSGVEVRPVHDAPTPGEDLDLLVVGGPTHVHGISTARTRRAAVEGAHEDGLEHHLEPDADAEPGLRVWLRDLPDGGGRRAATFDTRLDRSPWLTGEASHGIARRLRHRGYLIEESESFLVAGAEGPLADGELERARKWGRILAASLSVVPIPGPAG